MANITKATTTELSAAAFASAGDAGFSAAKPESTAGGAPFLKIDSKTGDWSYGQEDNAVPADALFAVFPTSFAVGFSAWKGVKLEAKRMAVIGQPPVNPKDLPQVVSKTGWEDNVAVGLVVCECKSKPELTGTVMLFDTRSRGGIEAWNKLYDATLARARSGEEAFAAIVSLDKTSYIHKEWDRVYKPIFKVEDWDTPAAIVADFGTPPAITDKDASDEQAEDEAPKPASRRRAAAPEQQIEDAEVVSEEAPRRRRRSAE